MQFQPAAGKAGSELSDLVIDLLFEQIALIQCLCHEHFFSHDSSSLINQQTIGFIVSRTV